MDPHLRNEMSRTPVAWQQRDANKSSARSTHSQYSRYSNHKEDNRHNRNQEDAYWKEKGSVVSSRRGDTRSQTIPISSQESAEEEEEEETTETESQTMNSQYATSRYPQFGVPVEFASHPPSMIAGPGMPGMHPQPLFLAPNGSIRSVHSVPMLAAAAAAPTWDGEPCPVHHPHHHPHAMPLAALYGMPGAPPHSHHVGHAFSMGPPSIPASVISGATTVRRARSIAELSNVGYGIPMMPPSTPRGVRRLDHGGSLHHHYNAAMMQQSNQRMVMSEHGTPSTLPLREHQDMKHGGGTLTHGAEMDEKVNAYVCCSGHLVVLWIILGIVTFGILLALLLKFTIT